MDLKLKLRINGKETKSVRSIVKPTDIAKYNLRCNRSLSEKMTQKDFVYDIRRPLQDTRKFVTQRKKSVVTTQEPRQNKVLSAPSNIMKNRYAGGDATARLPMKKILNHECNFCREPIATLFSLSTHVKFHRREYCKKCYWILEDNESMHMHFGRCHQDLSL